MGQIKIGYKAHRADPKLVKPANKSKFLDIDLTRSSQSTMGQIGGSRHVFHCLLAKQGWVESS